MRMHVCAIFSLSCPPLPHTGKLKDEYIREETTRVYPNGHSLWDKIECRGDLTLSQVYVLII